MSNTINYGYIDENRARLAGQFEVIWDGTREREGLVPRICSVFRQDDASAMDRGLLRPDVHFRQLRAGETRSRRRADRRAA